MTNGEKDVKAGEQSGDQNLQIPTITHLQFLVLDLLASSPAQLSSQALKNEITRFQADYGGPKFYQLMKRLNESGLVSMEARLLDVADSEISRTFYSITTVGRSALKKTMAFYLDRARAKMKLPFDNE